MLAVSAVPLRIVDWAAFDWVVVVGEVASLFFLMKFIIGTNLVEFCNNLRLGLGLA